MDFLLVFVFYFATLGFTCLKGCIPVGNEVLPHRERCSDMARTLNCGIEVLAWILHHLWEVPTTKERSKLT